MIGFTETIVQRLNHLEQLKIHPFSQCESTQVLLERKAAL